jgi:hypothetical protein
VRSNEEGFAGFESAKGLRRERGGAAGGGERAKGFVAAFVGQLPRAPMHADGLAGGDVAVDLDGFGGVAMLCGHEPAGLVGSDGNEGDVGRAEAAADVVEKRGIVAGVAGEPP